MKVRIYPTVALAGVKAMRCQSGCYLLEELGDKQKAKELAAERERPVDMSPFTVEIGQYQREHKNCQFYLSRRKLLQWLQPSVMVAPRYEQEANLPEAKTSRPWRLPSAGNGPGGGQASESTRHELLQVCAEADRRRFAIRTPQKRGRIREALTRKLEIA